jgi:hypothetical protein
VSSHAVIPAMNATSVVSHRLRVNDLPMIQQFTYHASLCLFITQPMNATSVSSHAVIPAMNATSVVSHSFRVNNVRIIKQSAYHMSLRLIITTDDE